MIHRSFLIILMITGICNYDFASYAQDNIPNGATITGEVIEIYAERIPIEEAEIKLISSNGKEYIEKSDTNGEYEFNDIPRGRYTINVIKAGYQDRLGKSIVVAEGGERYDRIKMIDWKHTQFFTLFNAEINRNKKIDIKRIESLIQHIGKEISQLYGLDEPTLKNLQESVMYSVKTTIIKDKSQFNRVYPHVSAEGNLGLLLLLLLDPDIQESFANYLTDTQLQNYIDSTMKRREQVGRTFTEIFTLHLDQALLLSPNQREDITEILYNRAVGELSIILNLIFKLHLPQTIVEFLDGSIQGSLKEILTENQYEIYQEIEMLTNILIEYGFVKRIQFREKEGIRQNRIDRNTVKLKIKKMVEAILIHHTKQFTTLDDTAKEQFALVNKGIVEEYIEKHNREAIKRLPLMVSYRELLYTSVTGKISRNKALQKLKVYQKNYWEDPASTDVEDNRGGNVDALNQHISQITLRRPLLQNIFNVVTEPIYQQTIKDTITKIEYQEYNKHLSEINEIRQRTAQKLMVEYLDMHLLLNTMQRRNIAKIASKLTIPVLNKIGLQFMLLELYLNIIPEDLSPWQQEILKQEVLLKRI